MRARLLLAGVLVAGLSVVGLVAAACWIGHGTGPLWSGTGPGGPADLRPVADTDTDANANALALSYSLAIAIAYLSWPLALRIALGRIERARRLRDRRDALDRGLVHVVGPLPTDDLGPNGDAAGHPRRPVVPEGVTR